MSAQQGPVVVETAPKDPPGYLNRDLSDEGVHKKVGLMVVTKGGRTLLFPEGVSWGYTRIMATPVLEVREGKEVIYHVAVDSIESAGGPQTVMRDGFWKVS